MKGILSNIKLFLAVLLWVLSASCLAIIGVKNAIKHGGSLFSVFEELTAFDMKLSKISAILFGVGVLLFIWGAISG